jgi:hypothetical protein
MADSQKKIIANPSEVSVPGPIQRIADSEDRRLAWHFFVFFSRMEFALKKSGKYLRKHQDAQPDWDKFGSDYDKRFRETLLPQTRIVHYFECGPPRKQIQAQGLMQWSEPQNKGEGEKQLTWLLRSIRTVRNNLFHGGKFPLMPIREPSRDRDLLIHSLAVLNAVLELDHDVRSKFFEHIDDN